MKQLTKMFVIAKRNIKSPYETLIQKDDVGIIESESEGSTTIFFIRIWQKVTLTKNDFKIFDVKRTGDSFSKKICNICHKLLRTAGFSRNQNARNENYTLLP